MPKEYFLNVFGWDSSFGHEARQNFGNHQLVNSQKDACFIWPDQNVSFDGSGFEDRSRTGRKDGNRRCVDVTALYQFTLF